MLQSILLTLVGLSCCVSAKGAIQNDWNKPCFEGECSYEYPTSSGAPATLRIWGSQQAVSDITPAGGWDILDCSPGETMQEIRIVCTDEDKCSHLFSGGAKGTIVRLPDSCGIGPFATVTAAHEQKITDHPAVRARRGDGRLAQLHAITIDIKPGKSLSRHGTVSFSLDGVGTRSQTPNVADRHTLDRRWDVEKSKDLDRITVHKEGLELFKSTKQCPNGPASISANVDVNSELDISIKFAARGTLNPPNIESLNISVELNGNLGGALHIDSGLTGSIDSGNLPIIPPIGWSPIEVPGILSIGPAFDIVGRFKSNISAPFNSTTSLNWKLDKVRLDYPSDTESNSGSVTLEDTPFKLSVSPNVQTAGDVSIHLIRRVLFGITAFFERYSSVIYFSMDTYSTITLFSHQDTSDSCEAVDAGLEFAYGTETKLGSNFSHEDHLPIYAFEYRLYEKCSSQAVTRREPSPRNSLAKRALGCPPVGEGAPVTLIDEDLEPKA